MAELQASSTTRLGGYYIYKSIWDASVALGDIRDSGQWVAVRRQYLSR